MDNLYVIAGYFAVGLIWGTTNALMEKGTKSSKNENSKNDENALKETGNMFSNWRFLLPFAINQLGSVINNFVVAASDLSIAIPAVNCITFIITYISQKALKGESISDIKFFMGTTLIMIGMYFCINKE